MTPRVRYSCWFRVDCGTPSKRVNKVCESEEKIRTARKDRATSPLRASRRATMRDLAMWAAGALGIVAAVVHGVLGETHVFAKARIQPAWTRRLLRLVWQCGALAWLGVGVLLIAAPGLGSQAARVWIAVVGAAVYGFAAAANAWATGGRHFGWMVLAAATLLALAGAIPARP